MQEVRADPREPTCTSFFVPLLRRPRARGVRPLTPDVAFFSQRRPPEVWRPSPGLVFRPGSFFDGPGAGRRPPGGGRGGRGSMGAAVSVDAAVHAAGAGRRGGYRRAEGAGSRKRGMGGGAARNEGSKQGAREQGAGEQVNRGMEKTRHGMDMGYKNPMRIMGGRRRSMRRIWKGGMEGRSSTIKRRREATITSQHGHTSPLLSP